MKRPSLIARSAVLLCAAVACNVALAQSYPAKPVRLVVGFATGGGTDSLARAIARKLAETWPQPIVVENRAGADGAIATEMVAKSAPDGYTLVMVSNAHAITPFLRNLAYDPVKDLNPITLVASTPNLLLVHPSVPARNVTELIALAKAKPSALSYGSSGSGTSPALAMELLKSITGTQIVEVPFKGSGPAVLNLMGGHIQLMFGAISTVKQHVESGRLRAIAISSPKRWPAFPDLPTVAETLPGFEAASWYGMLAPAGTPAPILARLHADVTKALQTAEVRNFITNDGFEVIGNTPAEFAQVIERDMHKWGTLIRSLKSATSANPAK
jgi:tripartite-type tricarboxylate transporter receptor subunit TctC